MCLNPVPCACTLEQRAKLRAEHIERHDALRGLTGRLHVAGQISQDEAILDPRIGAAA